jgi:hypothetical protein
VRNGRGRVANRPQPARPRRKPDGAGTVLVLGILAWVLCGLLGPIAWVKGNEYERTCWALRVSPDGAGTAGKLLGMIATIFLFINIMLLFVLLAV